MENTNGNQTVPPIQQPSGPVFEKKWYGHKGIICAIILVLVAGAVIFLYSRQESIHNKQLMDLALMKSRNANRVSDVQEFKNSLELYFKDHNQYPLNLNDLSPNYLLLIPSAPVPQDGSCTADQNTYTYTPNQLQSNFNLHFCLGDTTNNLPAGVHILSSYGIDSKIQDSPIQTQWSTYKSSLLNYQIDYPSNWQFAESKFDPQTGTQEVAFGEKTSPLQIVSVYNDPNTSHYASLDEYSQHYNTLDAEELSRTKISINGKAALQIVQKNGIILTFFMRDSDHQIFSVTFWRDFQDKRSIYDSMLEKLQF